MNKKLTNSDGDIDLIALLTILFEEKWKIAVIILISILISLPFYFKEKNRVISKSYDVKTNLSQGKTRSVFNYDQLSLKLEMSNKLDLNFDQSARYKNMPILLQVESLLEAIAQEFNNDRRYLVDLINEKISGGQNIDKTAYNLAKNFLIQSPTSDDKNFYLKFKWHDLQEGIEIFNQTLLNTKINLKEKIFETTNLINEANKKRLLFRLKELELKLDSIKSLQEGEVNLFNNYKELTSINYVKVKLEIDEIKNNQSFRELDDNLKYIENDDPRNWSNYSWKIADVDSPSENKKKHNRIIIFSIILGLLIGLIYVLMENVIRNYKMTKNHQ